MWGTDRATAQATQAIVNGLEILGRLPKHCDLSKIGPINSAAMYSEFPADALIRESVYTGMDANKDVAILKALVECVERLAFSEGKKSNEKSCLTERSDGFAAYPIIHGLHDSAQTLARQNAMSEAIERLSWALWWDDTDIHHVASEDDHIQLDPTAANLMEEICKITQVKKRIQVFPSVTPNSHKVFIYFLVLDNGGVVSGGACAPNGQESSAQIRALSELARHTICAKKLQQGAKPQTFYERRLAFMASENSSELLYKRLGASGTSPIVLPDLEIDEPLSHSLDSVVAVHRCYFAGQPPFIGGALERFCL